MLDNADLARESTCMYIWEKRNSLWRFNSQDVLLLNGSE